MGRKVIALGAIAAAITAAGCGSSSSKSAGLTLRRAADVTAQATGYRISGYGTVTVQKGPQHAVATMSMAGSFDRRDRLGAITTITHVLGHEVRIRELLQRFTVYMAAGSLPRGTLVSHGKPWLKLNISSALPGGGLSSLPTATDPSQFVDYLRAVSSSTTKLGTTTIRGVRATHYHAVVDLSRYPSMVPPAQRHAVRQTIKALETATGVHTLPLDVWIDDHHLVRRERFTMTECVAGLHTSVRMTSDMYDYGPQPKPRIPSASQVYDLTPLASAALRQAKLGCSSS